MSKDEDVNRESGILGEESYASGGMSMDNYDPTYDPEESERLLDEADRRNRIRLAAKGEKLVEKIE